MGRLTFENYARRAKSGLTPTEVAGRYRSQAAAERRIVPDVLAKLDIEPDDTLIEIGCGVGGLLIPIGERVASCVGVDHPDVLTELRKRYDGANLTTVAGNFLDIDFKDRFSKVLVYSVLHCLADKDEAIRFIDKALGLLAPGGRMLVGDIPTTERKARFLASETGKRIDAEWRSQSQSAGSAPVELADDPNVFMPTDGFVLELIGRIRSRGHHAYLLPQPTDLPFGYTREDILVESLK